MKSLTLSIGVIIGLTTALGIEMVMHHNINYLLLKLILALAIPICIGSLLITFREKYYRIMKQK